MTKQELSSLIDRIGIIPAIRVTSPDEALFAAETIFSGGIPVVEITMTTPGALDVIAKLAKAYPEAAIGAGTVKDSDTGYSCIEAGASFLTSTGLNLDIMACADDNSLIFPGALTPTEIMLAHKAGSNLIKIFPCAQMGGPAYIHALKAPFKELSFIAAGGVSQQTAADYIRAGATALGIGEELVPNKAILRKDVDWIHELVKRFLRIVRQTREAIHYQPLS